LLPLPRDARYFAARRHAAERVYFIFRADADFAPLICAMLLISLILICRYAISAIFAALMLRCLFDATGCYAL